MERVFIEILNMALTATWVVLAVLAVRALCHKAPKGLTVCLWALVGLRLVCPFLAESILSLIPSAEIVSPEILLAEQPSIHTGVTMLNSTVNPYLSEYLAPEYSVSSAWTPGANANPMQMVAFAASVVWMVGVAVMFAYSLCSYLWLRHKVKVSLCYRDNIYFCDSIATPFVFGIIRPRIYLPSGMEEREAECVLAHETAHLKRKDHWWKTIAFFLLSVYWFHPLLWISYLLFSKDIERASDERVIREMEPEDRKNYAEALVSCSLQKRRMYACPLAFGEVSVKNRVKSVLNYKKPALWIVAVTVVAGIAVAVCFLTNPVSDSGVPDMNGDWEAISRPGTDGENINIGIIGGADGPTAIIVGRDTGDEADYVIGQYGGYEDDYIIDTDRYSLDVYRYSTDEEGLYVFIWQLAANSYSCCVKEKTKEGYTYSDLWNMKSIGLEGARMAVAGSGYAKEAVTIVPFSMPYSSYLNIEASKDPAAYRQKLENLFWGEE